MSTHTIEKLKAAQLSLKKLEREASKTLDQLVVAIAIKQIWPEAFQAGSCNLRRVGSGDVGREGRPIIKKAYLSRADGETRDLTSEELLLLEPDTLISRNYGVKR